jgi:hypothetical protein
MAEQTKITRRTLFAGAGLLVVAGVAAKLAPTSPAPGAQSAEKEPEGDGYRLTEHIKKYYRTTTI